MLLAFTGSKWADADITILDVWGKKVFTGKADHSSIDVSDFSAGAYIINATSTNGYLARRRILVIH